MIKEEEKSYIDCVLLGKHLRQARKAHSLTQEQLAEMLNWSANYYGKIERGEQLINLERLSQISVVLRVPIEQLLAGCVQLDGDPISIENASADTKVDILCSLLKGRSENTIDIVMTTAYNLIKRGL